MYDGGKIIAGLVIFLGVVTFPFWYTQANEEAIEKPQLLLPADETECVEPTAYMRASHMQMLNEWRDFVVREGQATYLSSTGKMYEMSLTRTCMKCHTSRQEFCNKCHAYSGVSTPYCWDCHVEPKESA
ncbi:MAG: cytochrome C [Candidatus Abyssobacteria bacterium SURF_5]|uniref:Cytochrome C n=1 Tax=Abyssobacteria bacterium (strain SURF_5) TaxID=2093360 RepID=A0A3A4NXB6_ABYX5|nr:MAG: cytochrome C [Candidatus Abyssubacteria bacterium SURF_5]